MKQRIQTSMEILRGMFRHIQLKTLVVTVIGLAILISIATLVIKQMPGGLAFNGAYIEIGSPQRIVLPIDPFNTQCPQGSRLECICVKDDEEADSNNAPTSDETMVIDPPYISDDLPGLPQPGSGAFPWPDLLLPPVFDDLHDLLNLPVFQEPGTNSDSDSSPDDSPAAPAPTTPPPGLPVDKIDENAAPYSWLEKLFGINTNPGLPVNKIDGDAKPYSWLEKLFGINTNPGLPINPVDENAKPYDWIKEMRKTMQEREADNAGFASPEHRAFVEAKDRETVAFFNYTKDLSPENLKKWKDAEKEVYDLLGWPVPQSFLVNMPAPEPPAPPEPEPDPTNQGQADNEILPDPDNPEDDGTFVDDGKHWGCRLSISWQRPPTCQLLNGEGPDTCSCALLDGKEVYTCFDNDNCTVTLIFKDMFNPDRGGLLGYLGRQLGLVP